VALVRRELQVAVFFQLGQEMGVFGLSKKGSEMP
jgi:hypothetical protein